LQTITLFITKVSLYEIYDALQKKIMKMNLFIICKLRLVKTFSLYIITAMKSVSVTGKIEEEREELENDPFIIEVVRIRKLVSS